MQNSIFVRLLIKSVHFGGMGLAKGLHVAGGRLHVAGLPVTTAICPSMQQH